MLKTIKTNIQNNIKNIFDIELDLDEISLRLPPEETWGDYAYDCFGLAKKLKKSPNEISEKLAKSYQSDANIKKLENKGAFVNFFVSDTFLLNNLDKIAKNKNFGQSKTGKGAKILIEFSGPNTNKPQHIGHVRNDCLGQSLINIYRATGHKAIAVNIINDRGIHIVKSMLAWQEFGSGETPESAGLKGDHLVGKYYVKFGEVLKKEEDEYLAAKNINLKDLPNLERKKAEEEFLAHSKWMNKARKMLQAWEKNDPEVRKLWKMMNDWVYQGYDETYRNLDIEFDHLDFESENYLLGKDIIKAGLKKKVFFKKEDGSVWIDLREDGLDEKLVLRSDGTSVYITQDLAVAYRRFKKFKFDQCIYVVASEQDYHFKVLFLILKKLGYKWSERLHHLSYGMLSLSGGKIKSREGKTADADELIDKSIEQAKKVMSSAQKKVENSAKDKEHIAKIVGIGALKFFVLSVNPQKNITFNPEDSISFDGYTGTFIQYSHARIATMLKKASKVSKTNTADTPKLNKEEKILIKILIAFPEKIEAAGSEYNPAILSQYLFELAKNYNNFYQHHRVLDADNKNLKQIRLNISGQTKKVLKTGLELLGIEAPEIM